MSPMQWMAAEATRAPTPRPTDLDDEGRKEQCQRIVRAIRKAGSALTRTQIAEATGWSVTKVGDLVKWGDKAGMLRVFVPPYQGRQRSHRVMVR